MRDSWLETKFATLKNLGWLALIGALLLAIALPLLKGVPQAVVAIPGALLLVPGFVYIILMTVWHWKYRYRGVHGELWGALLLLETSGWFKIVYWFRHILPDWRGTGRYVSPQSREVNAHLDCPHGVA